MKLQDYKSREEIKQAIERRVAERESLLRRRDKPFVNYHFDAGRKLRNLEKNLAKLQAFLDESNETL